MKKSIRFQELQKSDGFPIANQCYKHDPESEPEPAEG